MKRKKKRGCRMRNPEYWLGLEAELKECKQQVRKLEREVHEFDTALEVEQGITNQLRGIIEKIIKLKNESIDAYSWQVYTKELDPLFQFIESLSEGMQE
jgi:hypothetical protein